VSGIYIEKNIENPFTKKKQTTLSSSIRSKNEISQAYLDYKPTFGLGKQVYYIDILTNLFGRGGLAPHILVGFFFKGPQKKIKNCCRNKTTDKKKKMAIAAAQTENFQVSADLKKKKVMMLGGPRSPYGPPN
jgi:hypothetical protein